MKWIDYDLVGWSCGGRPAGRSMIMISRFDGGLSVGRLVGRSVGRLLGRWVGYCQHTHIHMHNTRTL